MQLHCDGRSLACIVISMVSDSSCDMEVRSSSSEPPPTLDGGTYCGQSDRMTLSSD